MFFGSRDKGGLVSTSDFCASVPDHKMEQSYPRNVAVEKLVEHGLAAQLWVAGTAREKLLEHPFAVFNQNLICAVL